MTFSAKVTLVGETPSFLIPKEVMEDLFKQAGRSSGPIPVIATVQGKRFRQALVKFEGAWRFYFNPLIRKSAGVRVDEIVQATIQLDARPTRVPVPQKLTRLFFQNKTAKKAFGNLESAHQKEISHHLNTLKTEDELDRDIQIVIQHLMGKNPKALRSLMRPKANSKKESEPEETK